MYHAYERIYERCGLKAVPVQADGGDMGDSMTHEFHALADAGEAHFALEDIYVAAMDFDALTAASDRLIAEAVALAEGR